MDIGSTTMYNLHLGTCSFTWVRCVLKKDTIGGNLGVDCHNSAAAATTILVIEPPSYAMSKLFGLGW